MVRILLLTLLFITTHLSAGEFTASVRSKNVTLGKGFPLTLTLKDTTAKGTPNVSGLQQDFTIHSQQQSSSTIVTNGKLSSSTSWKFTLLPSKEGKFTIPAIPIDTSEGVLWSRPIDIEVVKPGPSPEGTNRSDDGFVINTSASKTSPYKDEPVTYVVRLVSQTPFANAQMEKFVIDNAIVEAIQEPKVYDKVINGVRSYVLEFTLLITPLKAGTVIIPSVMIQGEVPAKDSSRPRSFFDDTFNPFQMMSGFRRTEPFAVKTDETILNVQPPVTGIIPWLPANSLKIEEQFDENQKIQVGEPLIRNFRVSAVGLRAAQLPSLEHYVRSTDEFKVYSDKPETGENITPENIFSFRIEQYTIIPQKAGEITLPEIAIPWWDVSNNTKAVAKLPAKVLDVAPSAVVPQAVTMPAISPEQPEPPQQLIISETNPLLYAVIAGLAILLLLAFVWVFSLQKKIGRISETGEEPVKPAPDQQPKIRNKELQSVTTAKELHEFLQNYAHYKWNTPKNATIKIICHEIKDHLPEQYHDSLDDVGNGLENALYRNIDIDVRDLAKQISTILDKTRNIKVSEDKREKLPELNPN